MLAWLIVCHEVNQSKWCTGIGTSSQPACFSPSVLYGGSDPPAQLLLGPTDVIVKLKNYRFTASIEFYPKLPVLLWDSATIIQLYLAPVDSYNWYYECFLSPATPRNTKQSAGSATSTTGLDSGDWRYWIIMREPQAGGSECKVDKIFCSNLFIFGNLQKYCLQTSQIIW